MNPILDLIKSAKVIVFDFDGVIKESVAIKTNAFLELFSDFSPDFKNKVLIHHQKNTGISRYDKISFYFNNFLGEKLTKEKLDYWCAKYSNLTLNKVVQSSWVSGVFDFLKETHIEKNNYIATGTPQKEIEFLVEKTKIRPFFKEVFGSPLKKEEIIKDILKLESCKRSDCIMIGDSMNDYLAAKKNKIIFILRETEENKFSFTKNDCLRIKDFSKLTS